MKKLISLTILLIAIFTSSYAQTHVGSWIIGNQFDFNTSTFEYYELRFHEDGSITDTLLGNSSVTYPNIDFNTAGGFDYNLDAKYFVTLIEPALTCYDPSVVSTSNHSWDLMQHSLMTIPDPGSTNDSVYYAIYAANGTSKSGQGFIWLSKIEEVNSEMSITNSYSFNYSKPSGSTDWALSRIHNNDRYIYYTNDVEGLKRMSLDTIIAGGSTAEVIVPLTDPKIQGRFNVHELELIEYDDKVIIAGTILDNTLNLIKWDEITHTAITDTIIINKGKITGLEFSPANRNIIYLACNDAANGGIVIYDWFARSIIGVLPGTANYNNSNLQTAPDGYIYVTRNDGLTLGRINPYDNIFTSDVYNFKYGGFNAYLANKRYFDTQLFHLLPKHDVLSFQVDTIGVGCPGMQDGQVFIQAFGGAAPDSLICWKGDTIITGFEYDEYERIFYRDGLGEGIYHFLLIDATGLRIVGQFHIGINWDAYEYNSLDVLLTTSAEQLWENMNTSSLNGLTVPSGINLTIKNSTIQFGPEARIIIQPNASLTLDSTRLTDYTLCNLRWQGIEVQGNKTQPQQPYLEDGIWKYYQGRLIMNHSIMENAISAVGLLTTNEQGSIDWSGSGGIIAASNSYFHNNVNSVHFIPYKNYNFGSLAEIGNASYFNNCSFDLDQDYVQDQIFYKHADLFKVRGIEFRGCSFTNNAPSEIVSLYNVGIASYASGFEVTSGCTQQIDPCPSAYMDSGYFSGFHYGIYAVQGGEGGPTFIVRDATFENNAVGIFDNKVWYAAIINNQFSVGYQLATKVYDTCCDSIQSLGIDMQIANGFAIENNTFIKPANAFGYGYFAGIRVLRCPSDHDVIYKNTFDNLDFGNYAQGTNRLNTSDDTKGLEYQCNHNGDTLSNNYDFIVVMADSITDAMIRQDHGYTDTASGNTFSKDALWHIANYGTREIDWHYCPTCPNEEPTRLIAPYDPSLIEVIASTNPNLCPDHYNDSEIVLSESKFYATELSYAQNLSDFNSVCSLLESLKDGGDTESELSDIAMALPENMWDLRAQLLGDSPHLSSEVLMAMADRTEIFPDNVIFEILSANPDELSNDSLMYFLENKENPLPDYMISILEQLTGEITYKTILLRERDGYYTAKTDAAQEIIRSILNDSILNIELYRDWLDNMGSWQSDVRIASTYFEEGDTASALSLLNLIPDLYELTGQPLTEFQDMKEMLLMEQTWKFSDKMLSELDSTDIVQLRNMAHDSSGPSGAAARNILSYFYHEHTSECLQNIDTVTTKSGKGIPPDALNQTFGLSIDANPNPAHTFVSFEYLLPTGNPTALLIVSDISGHTILQIQLTGTQGQFIWDIRQTVPGVYLYTLKTCGLQKTGKLVIQ